MELQEFHSLLQTRHETSDSLRMTIQGAEYMCPICRATQNIDATVDIPDRALVFNRDGALGNALASVAPFCPCTEGKAAE